MEQGGMALAAGSRARRMALEEDNDESEYTYLPSDARAARPRRGDGVRAERGLRVGRDQAVLRGVLGVHVVEFHLFSPDRETSRPRLASTNLAPARRCRLLPPRVILAGT